MNALRLRRSSLLNAWLVAALVLAMTTSLLALMGTMVESAKTKGPKGATDRRGATDTRTGADERRSFKGASRVLGRLHKPC